MENSINLTLAEFGDFLSKLAEKSDSVYWLSSPDFKRIIYISPAYEKIWGRSREILYRHPETWIEALVTDNSIDHHPIAAMAEKIAKLGPAARYEEKYCISRPDGEVRWIIDRGFPIYNEQGYCCGVTGVAIDVTQDKLAEEALRKAKEQAEIANMAKSEFITNMGHDLRTPLNAILGFSSILVSKEEDANKKNLLEGIKESGEKLLFFINEILELCELEQGKIPLKKTEFDLKKLLADIRSLLILNAQEKGLDLIIEYPDIPTSFIGDKHRVYRVLLNLINNAVKFTEKGSVKVVIEPPETLSVDFMLKISIHDTGIGIPKNKLGTIFDRFTRLNPSYAGRYEGIGIGLDIVRQFIAELNGKIEVKSKVNVGTTFTCYIPLELKSIAHTSSKSSAANTLHKKHILVIEDEPMSQIALKLILTEYGAEVLIAETAKQALALVGENFDLILMDIGLPDMAGVELAKKITGIIGTKVPIIAVTAHLSKHTNYKDSGIQAIYQKPFTKEDFIEIQKTFLK